MSEKSRKEILELLAQGKISATDAAEMLAATKNKAVEIEVDEQPQATEEVEIEIDEEPAPAKKATVIKIEEESTSDNNGDGPNWLRVRVSDMNGNNKVSVNVPIGMFKFGLKLAKNFTRDLDGIDLTGIDKMMGKNNTLVEVEDETSNERVRIYFD